MSLKSILADQPFYLKSVALLFILGLGMLLFTVFLLVSQSLFFPGLDLINPEASIERQLKNIDATIYTQIASQLFLMLIPALIFAYLMRGNSLKYLKARKIPPLPLIIIAFLIVFLGGIVTQSLIEINRMINLPDSFAGFDLTGVEENFRYWQEMNEKIMDAFFSLKDPFSMVTVFVMIAIVPAVSEELLFRGVLQQLLTEGRKHVFVGILVTSLTFALIHFQFYNFLGLVFMSMVLGYLFYFTGNIWIPIIAHFLNNGIQVIMLYSYEFGLTNIDIEEVDHMPYWISIMSFIVLLFLFKQLKKHLVVSRI